MADPKIPWWVYAGGSIVGLVGLVIAAGYTRSAKAQVLGLSNLPDSPSDLANLGYMLAIEPGITAAIRQKVPTAQFTSIYRSDAVNDAVGGSSTSYHKIGLAIDYPVSDPVMVARWLRANTNLLPVQPRTVIAESTPIHLHLDFFAPGEAKRATSWMMESGGENNFVPLT